VLNIVKITDKDYSLIVNWNNGKDENYLNQWAGHKVYHYPITTDQIKSHAKGRSKMEFIHYGINKKN